MNKDALNENNLDDEIIIVDKITKITKIIKYNYKKILKNITFISGIIFTLITHLNNLLRMGYAEYFGLYNISLDVSVMSFWSVVLFSIIISICIFVIYTDIKIYIKKSNNSIENRKKSYYVPILGLLFFYILILSFCVYLLGLWVTNNSSNFFNIDYIFGYGEFSFIFSICIIIIAYVFSVMSIKPNNNYSNSDETKTNFNKISNTKILVIWEKLINILKKIRAMVNDFLYNHILTFITVVIIIFILYISLFAKYEYNFFKDSGTYILSMQKCHNIIEDKNKKYLLLQDKKDNKIIMQIVDEKRDEYNMKTYYVKKGEYAYLNEYNKLTIKVEECTINVK